MAVKFQRCVYGVCYCLIGPFVSLIYRFRSKPCKIKSKTFLALGNHTQNLDPALLVIGLRKHIRFVANASLTKGVAGLFLNNLFGIIPREKGAKGDAVISLIEKNLKAGVSVGMFPEGNRSWDGETEYISERTARLAKSSGAGLVTYRFTGGYLLHPRWADYKRRGPMRGEMVNEYTAEELSSMSENEVYDAICRDLYVNAYDEQSKTGFLYNGKNLAEGLEYAAYLCPLCHKLGTIHTKGNELSCSCGLKSAYLPNGRFSKGNLPFENFAQWNRFQKKWMEENAASLRLQTETPIAADTDFRLTFSENGKSGILSENAGIAVFGDRIELYYDGRTERFAMSGITGFGTFLSKSMYFNCGTSRYQLVGRRNVSSLKYYALWRVLSGRHYL